MEVLETPFNPIQLELLRLFSIGVSDNELMELKQILIDFKFRRISQMAERISQEKGWTLEDIENLSKQHRRTPYHSKFKN
jgi:hypothetical protein